MAVVAIHVHHCRMMTGQVRWWHLMHTAMGIGMVAMYVLPVMSDPILAWGGLGIFTALTAALLLTTIVQFRREGALNPLWLATSIDMAAMTYMFLPMNAQPLLLTWVVIAYLATHTLIWLCDVWARANIFTLADSPGEPPLPGGSAGTAVVQRRSLGLSGKVDLSVRITLAVMAASMGYMLLAMGPAASMAPMSGM
ncbi:MAG TPA: DUF5134 domain-containing protein [Ruania sp.]|nr:DUF5134 domain-containing protein [Ruania sp.]